MIHPFRETQGQANRLAYDMLIRQNGEATLADPSAGKCDGKWSFQGKRKGHPSFWGSPTTRPSQVMRFRVVQPTHVHRPLHGLQQESKPVLSFYCPLRNTSILVQVGGKHAFSQLVNKSQVASSTQGARCKLILNWPVQQAGHVKTIMENPFSR